MFGNIIRPFPVFWFNGLMGIASHRVATVKRKIHTDDQAEEYHFTKIFFYTV
jgi:hypothetical protein